MDKSHSTLFSISTRSMASGSDSNDNNEDEDDGSDSGRCNGSETRPGLAEYNGDSTSEISYNECDITLMDEDMHEAKNEAELMFFQVVEMLRFEEVCQYT